MQSFEPTPQPVQSPASDSTGEMYRMQAAIADLVRRMKSGANNFYWIAALSVINSALLQFGGGMYFVVGLAGTLLVDTIFIELANAMQESALVVKVIGLIVSAAVAGIFALFGLFANRAMKWAFIVGMIFYAIDTLLMLVFQEWMGLLFHVFFLFGLFGGLSALNKLQQLAPKKPSNPTDFPQNIGSS
ncbi:MAG: hypothetical protein IPM31_09780 [Anaerolineae bacterium]|nr:hypothetical protein [Anaerolineae bacterium]MBL8104270.1 hypothetical protein [Anaerolineales bacterium]MCC7188916.1 hypothetical protein [Anaerolineales bacterium]